MITPEIISLAFLGGLLPALLWLHFWLREDVNHPEPRGRIIFTFLLGAFSIVLVFIVQMQAYTIIQNNIVMIIFAAFIEELAKYGIAYATAFRTRFFDEPIDAVVYMITAALGFSALENFLYISTTLANESHIQGLVIGNLRFIGSSLTHIIASGAFGLCIAAAFYLGKKERFMYGVLGLILATSLHSLYNFFIIENDPNSRFLVLTSVWISAILLIIVIERIKFIKKIT